MARLYLFDIEAALARLAVNVLLVDLRYRCCRWTLIQMLNELLDLVLAALGFACDLWTVSIDIAIACLQTYRAIRCIGHEAGDTNTLCLLLGKGPEVDALDFALDLI